MLVTSTPGAVITGLPSTKLCTGGGLFTQVRPFLSPSLTATTPGRAAGNSMWKPLPGGGVWSPVAAQSQAHQVGGVDRGVAVHEGVARVRVGGVEGDVGVRCHPADAEAAGAG